MSETILKVKTSIPPHGKDTLERSQIAAKLEEDLSGSAGFTYPLTLVSAPAGSGKTTTIRMWLTGRESSTAWLTLDQGDNDRKRFWTYFISSLQVLDSTLGKGTMESLRSSGTGEELSTDETFLNPLLNDLFNLNTTFFIVLDDLHRIDNARIQNDLIYFIENIPPSIHLVAATRSDPPWPLHRWRARESIKEIRQKDLKLTWDETKSYINKVKGFSLDDHQLDKLYAKTEGWITGLQLTSLSLSSADNIGSFIERFTGSHRNVFEYLSVEVLERQPEHVQKFLINTSILNRLCAPLCDAVAGTSQSSELLENLERKQLFVVPLDDHKTWYRYHPLFADFLQHQLKRLYPGKDIEQHSKAAKWFLEAGEFREAIYHAFKSENLEQVALILHENYKKIASVEGPWMTLSCLKKLPEKMLSSYPSLLVYKAFMYFLQERREEAEALLARAEKLGYENEEDQAEYEGMLATAKAVYQTTTHDFSQALSNTEKALKLLPPGNLFWRIWAAFFSGDIRYFSGNPKKAYPFYLEAHKNSEKMGSYYLAISCSLKVANALRCLGNLQEAEQLTKKMLHTAGEYGLSGIPRTGSLWVLLGELLREKGELDEAERFMNKGILLSQPEKPFLGWCYLFKTALSFSKQKFHEALEVIGDIDELNRDPGLPLYIKAPAASWKARVLLELGKLPEVEEVLAQKGITEEGEVKGGLERGYLALSRLLMLDDENSKDRARRILDRVEKFATSGGNRRILLETLLVKACLAEQAGDARAAEEHLVKALQSGYESGYFQIFIDEGKTLTSVYSRILEGKHTPRKPSLDQTLTSFARNIYRIVAPKTAEDQKLGRERHVSDHSCDHLIVEELNPRELQILKLIAEGYSNQEISQKFFISEGTVKWHTSNIYGKMGARNRVEAVTLARKLKLLS